MWNYSDDDNDDADRQYRYWGARLMVLAQVVDRPKTDRMVRAWIKRRTGKEYFMIVTVLGVIIALSLVLAINSFCASCHSLGQTILTSLMCKTRYRIGGTRADKDKTDWTSDGSADVMVVLLVFTTACPTRANESEAATRKILASLARPRSQNSASTNLNPTPHTLYAG
jgi:hypothetical protein